MCLLSKGFNKVFTCPINNNKDGLPICWHHTEWVAQSIPTYTMAALQFPKNLCDQLDSVVQRFWWNPKMESSHYWTPISWSSLCRPLKEGGLGFRKSWVFNQALLSKLAWWILSGKNCLCVNILRAK